jgi:hypothetical protein
VTVRIATAGPRDASAPIRQEPQQP